MTFRAQILLLLACFLFLFTAPAKATHYFGSHLSFECLGGCQYRVWFYGYSDCASNLLLAPTPISIIGDSTNCTSPSPLQANWTFSDTLGIAPTCPGLLSRCESPSGQFAGVWQARWYRDYDFCNVSCSKYSIVYTDCCRNGSLTSLPPFASIANTATGIDLNINPCNNSPSFCFPQLSYISDGRPTSFSLAAHDTDGDSLVYILSPCLDINGNSVAYNPNFSPAQGLGPGWNISLDSHSGQVDISAIPGGLVAGVICISVEEYRNGVQIGQITKDFEIIVLPSGTFNGSPGIDPPQNITGGSANAYEVYTCLGSNLCFDIPVSDPDLADTQNIWWVHSIPGATLTDATNPTVMDSITGNNPVAQFCWTPSQTGTYSFCLKTQDNSCPLRNQSSRQIFIHVNQPGPLPSLTLSGTDLIVSPSGASQQWYVNDTLRPALTGDSIHPNMTGFYHAVITDSNGCTYNSDTLFATYLSREKTIENRMRVWPNPGNRNAHIENIPLEEMLYLLDSQGRLVQKWKSAPALLSLDNLPTGLYFFKAADQVIRFSLLR